MKDEILEMKKDHVELEKRCIAAFDNIEAKVIDWKLLKRN